MKALLAIAKQTVYSGLRSRVFHLLLFMLLLVAVVFPLTLKGDGTAKGQIQLSLTYSLAAVTALITASTLWLACSQLAREIESYQMHMVVTKPVGRWMILAGKWLGIFAVQTFLFLIAAGAIYGLVMYRYHRGDYDKEQVKELRDEVLTAREGFMPEQPDFEKLAAEEYQRRLAAGKFSLEELPEVMSKKVITSMLKEQVKKQATEVPWGVTRPWVFKNVKVSDKNDTVHLRYRVYVGSTVQNSQTDTAGLWAVSDASAEEGGYRLLPQLVMGGVWHEISFPASFITEDGELAVLYTNENLEQKPVIFQFEDGPTLLVPVAGFAANYARAMVLVIFQVAFLAAVGVLLSGLFSTPMAIFVGASYIVVGLLVHAVLTDFEDPTMKDNLRGANKLAYVVAKTAQATVVSGRDFNITADLTRGRLISGSRLVGIFVELILLRAMLLALLGVWLLNRREFGKVIRR